jgi:ABC-type Fe3+ transport system permease subunit
VYASLLGVVLFALVVLLIVSVVRYRQRQRTSVGPGGVARTERAGSRGLLAIAAEIAGILSLVVALFSVSRGR